MDCLLFAPHVPSQAFMPRHLPAFSYEFLLEESLPSSADFPFVIPWMMPEQKKASTQAETYLWFFSSE
jgi:hypothetical protein